MNFIHNTKWVGIAQVCKIASQLISMVVLARLIDPSQFGIMALAMIVIIFSSLFRELGTSAAIIQQKELSEQLKNAIFGLNVGMGSIVCVLIMLCAPLVSRYYEQPILTFVLLLLAISFPISSLGSAQMALLERDSKFKQVAFIEIFASFTSLSLAIITAYLGWGVYSLVLLNLSSAFISTVLLWLNTSWIPNFKEMFNLREIKKIFGYSGNLTLFNFINYFSRNADTMIIGKVFGTAILGAYSLAYRIMLFPVQNLTFVISRSLFPVMSRHQENDQHLFDVYLKVLSLILFLVFPLMSGLAILREPFIYLVFGKEWQTTADVLLWLAPTAVIQALLSTTGIVFMSKGKTQILFFLGVFGCLTQVSAFVIGAYYDIVTMTKFYFIANLLNAPLSLYLAIKTIHGKFSQFIFNLIPIIVINLITILFLKWLLNSSYFIQDLVSWWTLIVSTLLSIVVYFASSYVFKNQLFFIKKNVK